MSTVIKDKKQRRSTTPSNSQMKSSAARPKSTANKTARTTTTRNQTAITKLMQGQDLLKYMPKDVNLNSPTSFKLQNTYMIKNHEASGFESYYTTMKKRRTYSF